ncbi:MAG TPA: ParB N-terminal domain-containing protein [Candidatus Cybelea sp.]|jgi:hypothetical protein
MIQPPCPVTVPIDAIAMDDPFQVRVNGLDEDHVEAIVAECESGPGILPPVVLTRRQTPSGVVHYIVDGHHEVEAQRRAGRPTVQAIVVDLDDDAAIDLAWERNRRNGRPLSVPDRVAHYHRLRQRYQSMPKAEIVRICGLSRTTIWRLDNDVSGKQRPYVSPIVRYLRRVAFDPAAWDSAETAAREVRGTIEEADLDKFAQSLGDSALAALAVAEELGFSP